MKDITLFNSFRILLVRCIMMVAAFMVSSCSGYDLETTAVDDLAHESTVASGSAPTRVSAIQSLDLECFCLDSLSGNYLTFVNGLRAAEQNDFVEARRLMEKIAFSEDSLSKMDSLIDRWRRELLVQSLLVTGEWNALIAAAEADSSLLRDLFLDETELMIAHSLSTVDREQYLIPDHDVTVPMSTIISGQPSVSVLVNGKKKDFILDTGASLSVVSSDVVDELGIEFLGSATGQTGTSTSKMVEIRIAIARDMRIGDLQIKNHPVAVINGEDLEFSVAGIKVIDIDGILGLPFFMHLAVLMDFKNESLTLSRFEERSVENRNLFWLGYPMVRLTGKSGTPLLFGFDSGASSCSLTDRILDRIDVGKLTSGYITVGGAGGSEEIYSKKVSKLDLYFDSMLLSFNDMQSVPGNSDVVIVKQDGTLGIDIASGNQLSIDFYNGRLDIK